MASREVVVRLQLDDKDSVSKFQALRKEQAQLEIDFSATKKAIRDNAKELIGLNQAYAEGAIDAEQLAAKVGVNRTQFDALTKTLSDQDVKLTNVRAQTREYRNDLGGLTDAGLRFRDKMADANLVALKNAGILGQLDARSASLTAEINTLTAAYQKGAKTEKEYQTETAKLQKELDATNAKSSTLEKKIEELNAEFKAGKISQEQYKAGLADISKQTEGLGAKFDNFTKGQAGQLKSTLSSLTLQYIGVGAAVYGLFKLMGDAARITEEFDAAQSSLAAIMGTTKAEIQPLTEDAKKYGAITAFTASQVTELQTELGKLGFSFDQIRAATPAVLDLAAATGTDLANAATIAAQTLNAFGLQADETARVVDVIAKSANLSALDIDTFSSAMSNAAPAANAVGDSVEDAAAKISALVDAGIPAAKAGTDLRNIYTELAAKGLTWDQAMEQINGSTDKLTTATDLFGKRSGTAGIILSQNTEKLDRLTVAYEGASGSAHEMALTQLDNLKGDKLLLTSAWEGFVLSVDDGTSSIGKSMRFFTQTLTDVLTMLSGGSAKKSITDFTALVQKEYERLGGTEILSAKRGSETVNRYRLIADEVKKMGNTSLDIDLLIARGRTLAEEMNKGGRNKVEDAALLATFNTVNEEVQKRIKLMKEGKEADLLAAQAKTGFVAVSVKEGATLAELQKALKQAKADRDDLSESDQEGIELADDTIASIEKRIAALQGSTKSNKAENDTLRDQLALRKQLATAADVRSDAGGTPYAAALAQAERAAEEQRKLAHGNAELLDQIEQEATLKRLDLYNEYYAKRVVQQDQAEAIIRSKQNENAQAAVSLLDQRHKAEMDAAMRGNGDIIALIQRQAIEKANAIKATRAAQEQAIAEDYEAQYAILDAAGKDTSALIAEQEAAVNILKEGFRLQDRENEQANADQIAQIRASVTQQEIEQFQAVLSSAQSAIQSISDAQQARTDAELAQIDRRITAAKAEGRNTTELERQRAEVEAEAAKKRAAAQRLSAIVTAMSSIAAAIGQAIAAAAPGDPYTVAARIAAAAAAAIAAGAAVYKAINAIPAFAEGGEVPDQRGTVTSSWGKPIRRSNGDDVLVTLKRKEKVLNADQIARAEAIAGKGFWGRIGLPNHPTYASTTAFLTDQQAPRKQRIAGYAIGGTVGYIASPTVAELSAERNVAELRAVNFQPVVSVVEINKVQNRTRVAESLGTA